jgi:cell division protein FtsB
VTVGLFVYAVWAGNGEVRIYMVLSVLGGAVGYFLLFSRGILKLGYLLADLAALLWGIVTLPLRAGARLCKKIGKTQKKFFHYRCKWYKIRAIPSEMEDLRRRAQAAQGGGTQKASLLTKLVVLALLIGVATALLNLRGLIQQAQADLAEAQRQVTVQRQTNADLADAVENSGDSDRQADIARDKLGLVEPGEVIFYFTD